MEINLVENWHAMNNLVRGVVIALTLQALACIAVTVDRLLMLAVAFRKGRKFARAAGPVLARGDYPGALEIAREHKGSHLAGFIRAGVETFLDNRRKGHDASKSAELAGRALERKAESLSATLNRGMNILASTGSTAPFIGLLGTVLGILNAFKMVGKEGSGGISTIGGAIAEALIVTGYGLMVAIPAVLLFNWLSGRLAAYEAGLAHAKSELVDTLESGSAGHRGTGLSATPESESEEHALPVPTAVSVARQGSV
jgi:biopolymer transport protein ExbB/TolQ